MRLTTAVLIIAAVGGAGWYGVTHGHLDLPNWTAKANARAFPVDRVLTDRTGRTVAARLLARDAAQVRFLRTSDGNIYHYPLSSLSDQDQAFLREFSATRLDPLPSATPRPAQASADARATAHLQNERAELAHRINLLSLELEKRDSKSPTLSRDQIERRIIDARNRIIDIDKELLDLAFRSRGN